MITLKQIGLWVVIIGFMMAVGSLLHGCAALLPPTDTQLTACVGILDAQLKAGQIGSAQAIAYQAQIKGQPPVLPLPCQGHV